MKLVITNNVTQQHLSITFPSFSKKSRIGLATGSTPLPLYKAIVKKQPDASKVTTFNLDEYWPMPHDNPNSYFHYMYTHLFSKIKVKKWHIPNGQTTNIDRECKRYNKLLNKPLDIELLGLGKDDHIGFNEPGTSFQTRTHLTTLTQSTIRANKKYFTHGHIPKHALTMGPKDIMQAKQLLMIVTGKHKAKTLKKMLCNPINPQTPASILRKHNNATVIADKQAASKIPKRWFDEHPDLFSTS